jgi:hypothetical protein
VPALALTRFAVARRDDPMTGADVNARAQELTGRPGIGSRRQSRPTSVAICLPV